MSSILVNGLIGCILLELMKDPPFCVEFVPGGRKHFMYQRNAILGRIAAYAGSNRQDDLRGTPLN
jgi:hypothetical protein